MTILGVFLFVTLVVSTQVVLVIHDDWKPQLREEDRASRAEELAETLEGWQSWFQFSYLT